MAMHRPPSDASTSAAQLASSDEHVADVNRGARRQSTAPVSTEKIGVTMRVVERIAADPRIGLPLIDVAEVRADGTPRYTEEALDKMSLAALKRLGKKHSIGPIQCARTRRPWRQRFQRTAQRPAKSVNSTVENNSSEFDRMQTGVPRGRDNFDWEHEDIRSKSTWVRALRQPLESTAQPQVTLPGSDRGRR